MRGRWTIALVLVGLAMLVGAQGAGACSCAPQAPGKSLREADGAVVGRLVRVLRHGALHAVYRYEVRHAYKGALPAAGKMLDVHSARRGSACALPRRTDRSYGLFLFRRNGRWFGGLCGVVAPERLREAAANRPRIYRRGSASLGLGCAN